MIIEKSITFFLILSQIVFMKDLILISSYIPIHYFIICSDSAISSNQFKGVFSNCEHQSQKASLFCFEQSVRIGYGRIWLSCSIDYSIFTPKVLCNFNTCLTYLENHNFNEFLKQESKLQTPVPRWIILHMFVDYHIIKT